MDINIDNVTIFGVRHLSPSSAYNMRKELDEIKPDIVLIECPSDLSNQIELICNIDVKPPIAILSYTRTIPIHTVLYPFAIYSPEYQAILWAYENNVECRFIDLPSDVFLCINNKYDIKELDDESIYLKLEKFLGQDYNTFWERNFEQSKDCNYREAMEIFGSNIRNYSKKNNYDIAENLIRESYMKRNIINAKSDGFKNIFCVCGAYHVEGLKEIEPMSDYEERNLPRNLDISTTLMPYSYYRLSKRYGYGAGNQAPAYFELIWNLLCENSIEKISYIYMTNLANEHRKIGNTVSSAEVIDAIMLANVLSNIRGSKYPVLEDLKDAAITCIGHGSFSEISVASTKIELGNKIGSLPNGFSKTSIQSDFYNQLKILKLERFKDTKLNNLQLDLRENLKVKSEKSSFLDLNRSFFLHRLRVLNISFANLDENKVTNKNKSDYLEYWSLLWTPSTEIEIIEASLLGNTIEEAVSFVLKEKAEQSSSISEVSEIFEYSFLCGIPSLVEYIINILQKLSIDTLTIIDISKTSEVLSFVARYGDLRKFDKNFIIPLLSQLYLRACLILKSECNCSKDLVDDIIESIEILNLVEINNDFLETQIWVDLLVNISMSYDINTKCSGFAMAILIERGKISEDLFINEISKRLSKGVPVELGAGWFEGLARKNRYSLIIRLSLWEKLNSYLNTLDDLEFKKSLVFLRRAFCEFSASEKSDIAENLGEIWGYDKYSVSEFLMTSINENEKNILKNITEFDFDDI